MNSDKKFLTPSDKERVEKIDKLKEAKDVTQLSEMLADPSWIVRRLVIEAMAASGEEAVTKLCDVLKHDRKSEAKLAAAVDALVASSTPVESSVIELAGHENPAVAADAAQILGRRRNSASTETLIKLTQHQDDNVAVGAIEGLGRIGGRSAVNALIDIVNSRNFFRTFPAIDVLGRSGDPRTIGPLTSLLKDPNFLPEAARALGKSGEQSAISPLLELVNTGSDSIVRIAALALEDLQLRFQEKSGGDARIIEETIGRQVGPDAVRRLSKILFSSDLAEAVSISKLLGIIGNEEAEAALSDSLSGPELLATAAAESLKKISKFSDQAIIRAIREGNSSRTKVLLPLITKRQAAVEILSCLKDKDPEVRALTCDTLARLGNPSVVSELFPLLNETNLRVVHSATAAIQALGTREARSLANEWSKSENPIVRRACIRILTYFGDSSALGPLLKGIQDSDARVREAAIQGLPYLEEPKALEALYDACKNTDARIRSLAMRALGQLPKNSERTYSILLKGISDEDAWVRYYSVQSLGKLSFDSAAVDIIKLLNDSAGQVRVSAVEALSHMNVPEAHEALRNASHSGDIEVQRAALVGLGIARRLEDLPIVLNAASSSDVSTRLIALSALVNFPSLSVLSALSSAATDTDIQISSAAIELLSSLRHIEATEVLIELLYNPNFKDKATAALLSPNEGRVSGILVALESADDEMASVLISILSRLQRPEARRALLAAMRLTNTAARKAAASVMASRRDPEMNLILREAAQFDPSPEVRHICSLLFN